MRSRNEERTAPGDLVAAPTVGPQLRMAKPLP